MMGVAGPLEQDPRNHRVVLAVAAYLDVTPPTVLVMAQDGMLLRCLRLMRPPDIDALASGAGAGEAEAA
jgi:hypothetical protein